VILGLARQESDYSGIIADDEDPCDRKVQETLRQRLGPRLTRCTGQRAIPPVRDPASGSLDDGRHGACLHADGAPLRIWQTEINRVVRHADAYATTGGSEMAPPFGRPNQKSKLPAAAGRRQLAASGLPAKEERHARMGF